MIPNDTFFFHSHIKLNKSDVWISQGQCFSVISFSVHLESMPESANPTHLSYIDCYCLIFSVLIFCPGNYFPSTANSYPWKGDFLEVHKSHPSVYKE